MSLSNKISGLIEQQFNIKNHDNYLAYAIHKWAASEMSDSIALCITGSGECKIKYQDIANSFNITKEEIDQGNIESIGNKIRSEAEKEDSKFSELISRMDQSLKEQSEKSIIQILNSSAEEMLRSFCGQCNSSAEENSSPSLKKSIMHPLLYLKSLPQKVWKLLPIKILFQPNQPHIYTLFAPTLYVLRRIASTISHCIFLFSL